MNSIHVGFRIGDGQPVTVPLAHTVVSGLTQAAGKTTCLEGMIARSGARALAFVTKREESGFRTGRIIQPYYKAQADWQAVAALLEAALKERLKFQRPWIMRVTQGVHSLEDVRAKIDTEAGRSKRSLDQSMFTELAAYLDLVLPELRRLPYTETLSLAPGLNVMVLEGYASEVQGLVIKSSLERIQQSEKNTITLIPEAWEFLPQRRGSPVKLAAVAAIRKGGVLSNWLWLDSQDLAGVDAEIRKQIGVWILGVQRESNEVKRTLEHIPPGIKKPKVEDVMTLGLGQFFACWGTHVEKVYAQPAWADAGTSMMHAMGMGPRPKPAGRKLMDSEDEMWKEKYEQVQAKLRQSEDRVAGLETRHQKEMDELKKEIARLKEKPTPNRPVEVTMEPVDTSAPVFLSAGPDPTLAKSNGFDYDALVNRLRSDPVVLELLATRSRVEVRREIQTIKIEADTLRGQICLLIDDGYFAKRRNGSDVSQELERRGQSFARPAVYEEMAALSKLGFFTIEWSGKNKFFDLRPGMEVHIQ